MTKKKKQWLFGVGGFLLLGLIVGCANQEPEATQAEAEPAATAPADPAAEFSESTKLLLALYQELHLFKDDPEFHEVGFGACCRFHDWQTRVQELQSRTNLETLMDIDVVPGDLLVLGLEYMKSKGSPTAYTQTMDPKFRSRRERDGGPRVRSPRIANRPARSANSRSCFRHYRIANRLTR